MGNMGQYASTRGGVTRERTMAELVGDVIGDVQAIMRSEVQLARVETKEEVGKAARASKLLVVGGVFALFAGAFAFVAIFEGLCLVMAPWLAAVVLCVVLGVIAGGMTAAGRGQWKAFHAMPQKTAETVKENIEWARNQTK
jgi:hypothetical protein